MSMTVTMMSMRAAAASAGAMSLGIIGSQMSASAVRAGAVAAGSAKRLFAASAAADDEGTGGALGPCAAAYFAGGAKEYTCIKAEVLGANANVGVVTLSRPRALNALNEACMREVVDAVRALDADGRIGCVVLTGDGDKAFAAGADIKEMASVEASAAERSQMLAHWESLASTRKPIVAAVNGFALGGGCELAMMCDFIIASDRASFGQPEVLLGTTPGMGGSQRLTRIVGKSKAMDMVLDPRVPKDANIRAALATALQGLLRSAEFTGSDTRLIPTRDDLVQLTRDQMVIMMHPCKNMHHLGGKTCPLVIGGGGQHIDAVAEMHNLLKVDPTPHGGAPLFRDPATNRPLSYQLILDTTRTLMRAIGEDPTQFGTHSYRIGGATALFAAGASDTIIRTMGRWSSDLHRLYVRACFEQCVDWTRKAGSTEVSDLAGTFDEVDYY